MTTDRATWVTTVLTLLRSIAPEVEPEALELARPLRQQVDLDSMDWLNFLVGLHQSLGVEIAESDYSRLISLNDVVDYLQARLG
ncbi:MAG: acyl carrier protein [Rhodoferax sp.]|nr:acyl carrier protein [Rhodoferax sp.]